MPNTRADVIIDEDLVELVGKVEAEDISLDEIGSLKDAINDLNDRLEQLEED